MNRLLVLVHTLPRLGFKNLFWAAAHKLALRVGWYRFVMPKRAPVARCLFRRDVQLPPAPDVDSAPIIARADKLLKGELTYFSYHQKQVGSPPDWFLDPFSGKRVREPARHWSCIPDFGVVSDIKTVWEPSRWDWALVLAQAYRLTGDERYMDCLEIWSSDWCTQNPVNCGPNWKCGQEVSTRVLSALLTAYLLGQHLDPSDDFVDFVAEHCERIYATRHYALSQSNNHATSESAALYALGHWLLQSASDAELRRKARVWATIGTRQLVRCVEKLVMSDGSFSQYSINYHRVLLDTLSFAEFWRRELGLSELPLVVHEKCAAAAEWLYQLIDLESGDAPNLGSNDGACLWSLSSCPYRDYRPSVQLAFVLYAEVCVLEPGSWDDQLVWLGLRRQSMRRRPRARLTNLPGGGFVVLGRADSHSIDAIVRVPRYRFRPSHADAFHLDLWYAGKNWVRDGGSASYAADPAVRSYYRGVSSHNTVQFDERDQMHAVSRFLYGQWLTVDWQYLEEKDNSIAWAGQYTDSWGCIHERRVILETRACRVIDRLDGVYGSAVVRWRLHPGNWILEAGCWHCENLAVRCEIDGSREVPQLTRGKESRYYLAESAVPVLELRVNGHPATVETTFSISEIV